VGLIVVELRYLKRSEWEKLANSIFNLRDSLIFSIFYETGCSVSEISEVRIKDVSPNYISFGKRKSIISPILYAKIQTYLNLEGSNREFLFYSRQSDKITEKRVIQIVKFYSKRVGFEITPQILRYTHMAHAYEKNIPISTIIAQVGISKQRAVQIFSELTVKDQAHEYSKFYADSTQNKNQNG
jgi:integrase